MGLHGDGRPAHGNVPVQGAVELDGHLQYGHTPPWGRPAVPDDRVVHRRRQVLPGQLAGRPWQHHLETAGQTRLRAIFQVLNMLNQGGDYYEALHQCGPAVRHPGDGGRSILQGVHQIERFYRQNHPLCGPYPLFSAGHGVFPGAAPAGKKLFLHRGENRAGAGGLPCGVEPGRRDACGAGRDPGVDPHALLRHERGDLRHCRYRAYPAGRQHGAAAGAGQTRRIGGEGVTGGTKQSPRTPTETPRLWINSMVEW